MMMSVPWAAPARRAWTGLLGRLWPAVAAAASSSEAEALGELRGDVRTCEYGDVHVMWEMLGGADDASWMMMRGGSGSGSGSAAASSGRRASATSMDSAAAARRKQRRRSRKAAADAAAWSRLFSTCCAF